MIGPSILRRLSSIRELIARTPSARNSPASTRPSSPLGPGSPYETNYHPEVSSPDQAREYERKYPLLDMDLLDIKDEHRKWFRAVNISVRAIMNGLKYDSSHNYQHVRRVVENGRYILEREAKKHAWAREIDPIIVYLGCLVHDVGDRKYQAIGAERGQETILDDFLSGLDVPLKIRSQVAYLASHVSFSREMHDQKVIASIAKEYPVLRIIQDADRLDELGTVGVARLFVCRGMDEKLRYESIDSDVALIEGRLSHYPGLMKTKTGREIAEKRYKWMVDVWLPQFWKETVTQSV
jgi:uncharacterized protein